MIHQQGMRKVHSSNTLKQISGWMIPQHSFSEQSQSCPSPQFSLSIQRSCFPEVLRFLHVFVPRTPVSAMFTAPSVCNCCHQLNQQQRVFSSSSEALWSDWVVGRCILFDLHTETCSKENARGKIFTVHLVGGILPAWITHLNWRQRYGKGQGRRSPLYITHQDYTWCDASLQCKVVLAMNGILQIVLVELKCKTDWLYMSEVLFEGNVFGCVLAVAVVGC